MDADVNDASRLVVFGHVTDGFCLRKSFAAINPGIRVSEPVAHAFSSSAALPLVTRVSAELRR